MPEVKKQPPTAKELQRSIYLRCASDPIFFLKNFVFIQTTDFGRVLFNVYLYQDKLLHVVNRHDRTIILKSRQLGITTLLAAYSLWKMIFQKDFSVLTVAPDRDKAKAVILKIQFAYDNLPAWLKEGCADVEHNKSMLRLSNGSKAEAVAGSKDATRSKTANFLIIDEAAFIKDADETCAAALQILATGGKCVMLSTPNGAGGYFHEKWEEAEQNDNAFVPVTLPWNVHPSHDQKWRDEQDKELGKRMAAQECDCEFNQSGDGYFEPDDVDYYKDLIEDPIETRGPSKDFWIWEFPIPNRSYMVILDTARGDGNDSSTIQVVDIFTGDQVAEYKGDMPPKLLAKFAVSVAIDYNSALLISENTGIGETTTTEVVDLQYSNIFYSPKGESTDITAYLAKNYENDISKMTAGFTMSTKTRPLVLHSFRQYTMDRSIKLRSRRIHSEMKTFIWKNAKPQARQGFNDDLIMPYAIGMYLRDSAIEKRNNSVDMTRATMAGIQKFTPMSAPMLQKNFVNPYLQNVNGKMEDISWLL